MDHQIPKSLTFPLGTWVHMLQSFPVLPCSLGQRLMGQRCVMDSLTICRALCSRWMCGQLHAIDSKSNWKGRIWMAPKAGAVQRCLNHVLSKCVHDFQPCFLAQWVCFCSLCSEKCSQVLFWVAFHAHLCTVIPCRSLCGTLSWICCWVGAQFLYLQCYCLSYSLELFAPCFRGWGLWTFRCLSSMWGTLE